MQYSVFILELTKTIGLGSLLGVAIGLGATRGQKKREALYAIKATNYREIVADYRDLSGHLHEVRDSIRSTMAVAETLARFSSGPEPLTEEVEKYLIGEFEKNLDAFIALGNGLSAKLGAMMTHRSETEFHSRGKDVSEWCTFATTAFMYFKLTRKQEDLDHVITQVARLEELIAILRFTWDDWKVQAERYASGMRPTPRFRGHRIYTERLM